MHAWQKRRWLVHAILPSFESSCAGLFLAGHFPDCLPLGLREIRATTYEQWVDADSTDIPRFLCQRAQFVWLLSIHHKNLPRRRGVMRSPAMGCLRRGSEPADFVFIRARLCLLCPSHLIPGALHAGAGGARNRAMSMRISLNICRGTATSAIWNMT